MGRDIQTTIRNHEVENVCSVDNNSTESMYKKIGPSLTVKQSIVLHLEIVKETLGIQ